VEKGTEYFLRALEFFEVPPKETKKQAYDLVEAHKLKIPPSCFVY
jgi:hypothetical protein